MQSSFIRNTLNYLPSRLLPAITGFITAPILTHLFLPAEYGSYALVTATVDFLYAFAVSGISSAAVRFFPAYKAKSESNVFYANMAVLTIAAVLVMGLASFFLVTVLKARLSSTLYSLMLIGIFVFIAEALFTVGTDILNAQQRSGLYSTFQLFANYAGLGIGLLLVIVFKFRTDGLLWGTLIAFAIALPFLLITATHGSGVHIPSFRTPDASMMWNYAWPLALGNMAMWGLRLSDRYIIGLTRPASDVGLYSVAYNLSGKTIDLLVALFLLSMAPMIMNTWENRGEEDTTRALTIITRIYLIVCVPAAAGLSILALPFMNLLTSEAYHSGYTIIGFVAFSSFAWGLSQIASRGLIIHKKTHVVMINQIVAAGVNIGLNIVLVPRYGIIAAGATTLVGYAILLALQVIASRKYLVWRFPVRTGINVLIGSGAIWLITLVIRAILGTGTSALFLFASVAAALPVYFGILWLLGEASDGERNVVKRIIYRVAGREA